MTSPETLHHSSANEILTLNRETISVDLRQALPETDPANLALAEAGVHGTAHIAIEAGKQRFIVANISQAPTVAGSGAEVAVYQPFSMTDKVGNQSPQLYRLAKSAPYVLLHFDGDGLVTGRAIIPDAPIILGRSAKQADNNSKRFEYAHDLGFAPYHLLIQPNETAQTLQISSLDADFPTKVRRGIESNTPVEKTRRTITPPLNLLISDALTAAVPDSNPLIRPKGPDYANASKLHPYELWAREDNDARTFNIRYIEQYQRVRKHLVQLFETGYLYTNTSDFIQTLADIHAYLGKAGVYNEVNRSNILDDHDLGKIRSGTERPTNRRIEQSLKVVTIAKKYGDPYGANDRLERGEPLKKSTSQVDLPGITPTNQPGDVVVYDENGNRDPKYGYQYFYPSGDSLNEYFAQMTAIGHEIEVAIKTGNLDTAQILHMIGQQYQYGACARPFNHVNNSIFMELANTQIKILGFKGVTHGLMDIAAQRMQPSNFARYFAARALGQEQ